MEHANEKPAKAGQENLLSDMQAMLALRQGSSEQELAACNEATAKHGLSLTQQQMQDLSVRRVEALRATGRVEFGGGVLRELAAGFGGSPYVMQENYADVMADVQDVFYRMKDAAEQVASESAWGADARAGVQRVEGKGTGAAASEPIADEDLVAALRYAFDHEAHGSTDLLSDVSFERLRALAEGQRAGDYDKETELDAFEADEKDLGEGHRKNATDRVYEPDFYERPDNDFAAQYYESYNELYRIGFDSNSRIGGSSLG